MAVIKRRNPGSRELIEKDADMFRKEGRTGGDGRLEEAEQICKKRKIDEDGGG